MTYVDNVTLALANASPESASTFYRRRALYVAEIEALDAEIRSLLAEIPDGARTIVTSHDAFQYFGRDYGLAFIAPQGLSTESEASAKDVVRLIELIRSQGIRAVFLENIADPPASEAYRGRDGRHDRRHALSRRTLRPRRSRTHVSRHDAPQCTDARAGAGTLRGLTMDIGSTCLGRNVEPVDADEEQVDGLAQPARRGSKGLRNRVQDSCGHCGSAAPTRDTVTNCARTPILQLPMRDPAKRPWREVTKVARYDLSKEERARQ